ncbi:hypothetical protein IFM58399_06076 [Aspergillus lentulus]|nr:uncharacterized protein IFM58399_06076 [Aspergillus lentulus]KAF4151593.1 hypothetical protein CNMCM6069_003609 [Aspergillus lentulus]KAF4173997.1 hypothetical protein CNMCM8060_009186 [Aspergillus lentulus]KAF4194038.1 hypothetical protein CNMCM8694_008010 [Aspergillus lentulus]GFF40889.1 hypothetical protein IFM58399_06076 [Aspergillus lentulus]GFG13097.1 hypothetical protein IFM61392_07754 [Aspergillus lentulus]
MANITPYIRPGSPAKRYFCSTCGCEIGGEMMESGDWVISTAIFDANRDDTGIWDIKKHIYTEPTLDGGLAEWLPRIGEKEMTVWNPPDDTIDHPQEIDGKLLAQCDCGGVSFHISRPTQEILDDPEMRRKWVSPVDKTKWIACLDACDTCRLTDGAHVIAWTFIPKKLITPAIPDDLLLGSSRGYVSSKGVRRTFCGTCGARVFYDCDGREEIVDVAIGLLRAPEGVKAENWLTWRTKRMAFPEDGMRYDPVLTESLRRGFEEWGKRKHGDLLDITIE